MKKAAAVLTSAFALIAVGIAPASAHQSIVEQGEDYALTATNHNSGSVCDWEKDGHFVSATWRDSQGRTVGYEEDGGDSGCDERSFKRKASTVVVCELDVGAFWCTDTHKV